MTRRAARSSKPHDQGCDGQTLPLRQPRAAPRPSGRLRQRLQLWPPPEDPAGSHALRGHLQGKVRRAQSLQVKPAPLNAGTKRIARSCRLACDHEETPSCAFTLLVLAAAMIPADGWRQPYEMGSENRTIKLSAQTVCVHCQPP